MTNKYLILLSLLLLAVQPSFSQAVPGAGRVMFETGMTFGGEKIVRFDGLQARYLLTDRIALRAGVSLDFKRNSHADDAFSPKMGVVRLSERSDLCEFNVGAHYRLLPSSRISPYVGFEVAFGNKTASAEYTDHDIRWLDYTNTEIAASTVKVDGMWRIREDYYYDEPGNLSYSTVIYYDVDSRAYRSFRAGLLIGSDFYVTGHLYLGFELGLRFETLKYKPVEITETYDQRTSTEHLPSTTSRNFGFAANKALRLGVWF